MNLADAGSLVWDIAIIGAGPAGGVAAALLAGQGRRVLLIEKSRWPREKVCGGCLNAPAVRALSNVGLASSLRSAQPVTRAVWTIAGKSVETPAAGGVAMLRSDLDAGLVNCATARGVTFLPHTAAKILPASSRKDHRVIQLHDGGAVQNIRAKMVLACDGVMGTSLDAEPWSKWQIARNTWMGVSMTCTDHSSHFHPGTIHMHIGHGGYVGAVQLANGTTHFAAALAPRTCRESGGPANLMENILASNGFESATMKEQTLHGAGSLTRYRRQLGGHRVLAVGDACGYIEPFTGEGISWAIQSAIAAVDLLPRTGDWRADLPEHWRKIHAASVARKQRWCSALRPFVHYPLLARLGVFAARALPVLPRLLAERISASAVGTTGEGAFA